MKDRYTSYYMYQEIHEQAKIVVPAINKNQKAFKEIAEIVKLRNIKEIVFVARGSSEHACLLAKYFAEIMTKMRVTMVQPSIITAYEGKVDYSNTLCIAVSQSGGAKDVIRVLEYCKEQGAETVTLTNVRGSRLSKLGDININNECGKEFCVTATKSFLSQVVILMALIASIAEDKALLNTLLNLDKTIEKALTYEDEVKKFVPMLKDEEGVLIFARGLHFPLGLEIELKLQETCTIDARCYSSSDYRHGPIVTSNLKQNPCIFYVADKHTNHDVVDLIEDLHLKHGHPVMVFTDIKEIADKYPSILIDAHNNYIEALFMNLVLSQLLSFMLSLERGFNPDEPIGVTKNTVTY